MFAGFDKDTWGSRNNQSKDYFKDYSLKTTLSVEESC